MRALVFGIAGALVGLALYVAFALATGFIILLAAPTYLSALTAMGAPPR